MADPYDAKLISSVKLAASPINGSENDYDELMRNIGDCSIVLIGEASHGTHEFYQERARITQRLIREKGFTAIALEADWPDAYRVSQYVRILSEDESADSALSDFKRFPTWMWRNLEVMHFVDWLHRWNQGLSLEQRIGIYGLDLYSLYASIEAVIRYLELIDPRAAEKARKRYGCFELFHQDMQEYGFMTAYGLSQTCETETVQQLVELRQHAWDYANRDGRLAEDEFFNAEMNANLARDAERYYRIMFQSRVVSWNVRDTHMAETLDALFQYLRKHEHTPKIVVWAHNSHVGDARSTYMGGLGEINIGQLARQRYGDAVYSVGFTTHSGTVTATSEWDMPAYNKRVRPSLPGSWENLFHETELRSFFLNLRNPDLRQTLNKTLLERAIGVIYMPETERQSHYFEARLIDQFDSIIHIDITRAVEPVHRNPEWVAGELPETFPSAL